MHVKTTNSIIPGPLLREQLLTVGHLENFKNELLADIKTLLLAHSSQPAKKWLKTYEVLKLLRISHGSLQTLRNNGTIPATKIGGLMYYDQDEINKIMSSKQKQVFQHNK